MAKRRSKKRAAPSKGGTARGSKKGGRAKRAAAGGEAVPLPEAPLVAAAADERLAEIELHRRALRLAARREVQERIDDYFEAVPPQTREVTPAEARVVMRARPAAARRIRVIAEGDSWFDYPWFLLRAGGIVPRLESRLHQFLVAERILNLAHYGHEVRQMLGVTQREDLVRSLKKSYFDAILFSGGGNDIVGDQLALWLKEARDASGPADALRDEVFQSVLNIVLRGYGDLVEIRDEHAKGATIFVHAYSVPYPQNKGVCGVGPWIFPALRMRGWSEPGEQRAIVREMLVRFGTALRAWAAGQANVVYVPTLEVEIKPQNWHNEIHPDSDGFNQMADLFAKHIREHFGLR